LEKLFLTKIKPNI